MTIFTLYPMYRVAQINPYKFQMVRNTHTKRNGNICFIQVIAKIHISQNIVMFDKSTKITEWSKQKEMPLLNHAARATPPPTQQKRWNTQGRLPPTNATNMTGPQGPPQARGDRKPTPRPLNGLKRSTAKRGGQGQRGESGQKFGRIYIVNYCILAWYYRWYLFTNDVWIIR